MPAVRLVAEGVGPFDRLDLDLSDGHGNPHLGPHILAGVNGSGKSTVLRTLAWVLDRGHFGLDYEEWKHSLSGRTRSRAYLFLRPPSVPAYVQTCTTETAEGWQRGLQGWIQSELSPMLADFTVRNEEPDPDQVYTALLAWSTRLKATRRASALRGLLKASDQPGAKAPSSFRWARLGGLEGLPTAALFDFAAYAPSRSLKFIPRPDLTKTLENPFENTLAFESTVQNRAIHAWLLGLYSKVAIAAQRRQPTALYTRSLERFENALKLIYGGAVSFDVEIEPVFQPRLVVSGRSLNFSQLPEGIRSTVAWLADFMMRQDLITWAPELNGKRPGVLLLDEVDAHLHPRWQRVLLPAMREALPEVQIIVTSHSPFVISSCPGSRVHVLELDQRGVARARPPVDAPIGETITTTLKDIFGVDSHFDVGTEKQLRQWNELRKRQVAGDLTRKDKRQLQLLTIELSARSEELRSIVAPSPKLPSAVVSALTGRGRRPSAKR